MGSFFSNIQSVSGAGTPGRLAMTGADRQDGKKQFPVYDEQEILVVITTKDRNSGKLEG